MTFGEKVKALRKAKGWTQGQLATYSGLTMSYISRIEMGSYEGKGVGVEYRRKLTKALDVNEDWLFGESPPDVDPQDAELEALVVYLMGKHPNTEQVRQLSKVVRAMLEEENNQ
jgi:transcriptional regulator with XRE-family HTH domain